MVTAAKKSEHWYILYALTQSSRCLGFAWKRMQNCIKETIGSEWDARKKVLSLNSFFYSKSFVRKFRSLFCLLFLVNLNWIVRFSLGNVAMHCINDKSGEVCHTSSIFFCLFSIELSAVSMSNVHYFRVAIFPMLVPYLQSMVYRIRSADFNGKKAAL